MARKPVVHFRLKKPPIDEVCKIYLEFLYNKRRLYYSFGQSVNITEWNE
jgi:hypothetical protein